MVRHARAGTLPVMDAHRRGPPDLDRTKPHVENATYRPTKQVRRPTTALQGSVIAAMASKPSVTETVRG